MSYGTQNYGTSIYGQTTGAREWETPEDSETVYNESISFPLRFTPKSDLELAIDDQVIKDNMKNSVMMIHQGLPLRVHLGSLYPTLPFDPNDIVTKEQALEEIRRSVKVGEPRVILDPSLRLTDTGDEEYSSKFVITYRIRKTADWKTVYVAVPRTDL